MPTVVIGTGLALSPWGHAITAGQENWSLLLWFRALFNQSQYIVRLGKTIGFVRSIYSAPLPSYARVSASMSNFFILRNA